MAMVQTKGITKSDLKRWALFGLVDKVGIVLVIQLNTIFGSYDSLPGIGLSDTTDWVASGYVIQI